jgi:hypothetical protein
MDEQEAKDQKKVPSSEILIAIPAKKGSKKYTTYLGLVDSGASASLVSKDLVEMSDFDIKMQKKPTKWDTANGVFKTDGSVIIENFNLPQFTRSEWLLPLSTCTTKSQPINTRSFSAETFSRRSALTFTQCFPVCMG